jgi:hypothetical protein
MNIGVSREGEKTQKSIIFWEKKGKYAFRTNILINLCYELMGE